MQLINIRRIFPLLLITMLLLFSACNTTSAQTTATTPTSIVPPSLSTIPTPAPTTTPSPASATPPQVQILNRIEVVYFHLPARCVTCLCFETQLNYVMQTYFKGAINTGKLIYKVVEIGKKENALIVSKYNAYGSQLFINIFIGNKDNITEIQDIWYWKCPTDKNGFNMKIKNLIEQNLSKLAVP